jgi:hypothetical protein
MQFARSVARNNHLIIRDSTCKFIMKGSLRLNGTDRSLPGGTGRERPDELGAPLEKRQVSLQFKLGDMSSILVPFDLFVLDKFLEDVVSQRFFDQLAFLRQLNGFQ